MAAGVANLVGDMVLILQLRMGIGGAAIATTAAQWAGALFFLGYLRRQARRSASMPRLRHGTARHGRAWHGMAVVCKGCHQMHLITYGFAYSPCKSTGASSCRAAWLR